MPCEWNHPAECMLSGPYARLFQHYGITYCLFHLPLDSPHKENSDNFTSELERLQKIPAHDFSGVQFPGKAVYRIKNTLELSKIRVGAGATLVIEHADADLSGATFDEHSTLQVNGSGQSIVCKDANMSGRFTFEGTSSASAVTFDGSGFKGTSRFNAVNQLTSLGFIKCSFAVAPTFSAEGLTQNTRFRYASFVPRPEDEHAYRIIRIHFSKNQDRDSEGDFYAREKRCQRLGLRPGLTRATSFLYDVTSEYGQSYVRAFCCFCLLQALCALIYAGLSGRLALGGSYDSRVVAFTFAQIAKPFELFSGRPVGSAYDIVGAPRGAWQFVTAVQSTLSLALLALFLLALRWRFKRD